MYKSEIVGYNCQKFLFMYNFAKFFAFGALNIFTIKKKELVLLVT